MKIISIISLLCFCFISRLIAQPVILRQVCKLPGVLLESSGLEYNPDGSFWSHNDSGGQPELYKFDSTGNLTNTIKIENITNTDWEDICLLPDGRILVADIGNNNGSRTNLKILIVEPGNLQPGVNLRQPQIIAFNYSEQNSFPPAPASHHFDAEAIIYHNDSIFLFTKNRSEPFNGLTYIYRIPVVPGNYTISRVGEFYIASDPVNGRITAADYEPVSKTLFLLSTTGVFPFNCSHGIVGTEPLGFNPFGSLTQKEGIAVKDSCTLLITDEYIVNLGGGNLYEGKICDFVTETGFIRPADLYPKVYASSGEGLLLELESENSFQNSRFEMLVVSVDGRTIFHGQSESEGKWRRVPIPSIKPNELLLGWMCMPDRTIKKFRILSTE